MRAGSTHTRAQPAVPTVEAFTGARRDAQQVILTDSGLVCWLAGSISAQRPTRQNDLLAIQEFVRMTSCWVARVIAT